MSFNKIIASIWIEKNRLPYLKYGMHTYFCDLVYIVCDNIQLNLNGKDKYTKVCINYAYFCKCDDIIWNKNYFLIPGNNLNF